MHWKTLRTCAVFAITVVLSLGRAATTSRLISFPSSRIAVSPNGRFAVIDPDSDEQRYHSLFLEDRRTHERRKLLEYQRWVEVLWNPNSTSFAVNDHMGSNISESYVYSTDPDKQRIDVEGKILAQMKTPGEKASVTQNLHVYWEAVRWVDSKTLRVKVWGYGEANPGGFTRYYKYRLR